MAIDIAVDLGSSKTAIYASGKVVLEQPTVVTVDADTFEPKAFGAAAKETLGRTPDALKCVFPIEHGSISDYDTALAMMSHYMFKVFGNKIIRPKAVVALPTGLTELQHRFMGKVIEESGGRGVTVVDSPIAAAIGVGIDLKEPMGRMIIDIGAGVTDIASISMGGIVQCDNFNVASNDFDDAIIKFVRRNYNIEIGSLTAERIKKQVGTVVKRPVEIIISARGRNLRTGLPETFEISSAQVYETLFDTALTICNAVRKVLEKTDPDIVADIMENGIFLTGGGAQINGMVQFMKQFLGTEVFLASDPSHSVIKGTAYIIKHPSVLKNINYQIRSMKDLIIE